MLCERSALGMFLAVKSLNPLLEARPRKFSKWLKLSKTGQNQPVLLWYYMCVYASQTHCRHFQGSFLKLRSHCQRLATAEVISFIHESLVTSGGTSDSVRW